MKRAAVSITLIVATLIAYGQVVPTHKAFKQERIFKDRYIKKVMKNAASWQLAHPKHELYEWHNGAFYAGLMAAYETTGSAMYHRALMDMGEKNGWKPGKRLHHADDYAICQTYVDLYRIEKDSKMIAPFIKQMEEFLDTPYQAEDIKKVTWWWCDALFMAPPAFIKLGLTMHNDRYIQLADSLFIECYDLLYNREERLFARDLRYTSKAELVLKEANGEKIFWSRGNGWVLGGLARILQELPNEHSRRPFYEQLFQDMATRIVELQQEDGLWRASLLDPASYPGGEASGSAFYAYALAWGINSGLLDKATFQPAAIRAWTGLVSLIQSDGRIGWVQPVGADPRKDFSSESWEVYGTGAFLLAASEIMRF